MWAGNWAAKCGGEEATDAIMREAQRQCPTMPALSIIAEVQHAVNTFPGEVNAELHAADGTVTKIKKDTRQ